MVKASLHYLIWGPGTGTGLKTYLLPMSTTYFLEVAFQLVVSTIKEYPDTTFAQKNQHSYLMPTDWSPELDKLLS